MLQNPRLRFVRRGFLFSLSLAKRYAPYNIARCSGQDDNHFSSLFNSPSSGSLLNGSEGLRLGKTSPKRRRPIEHSFQNLDAFLQFPDPLVFLVKPLPSNFLLGQSYLSCCGFQFHFVLSFDSHSVPVRHSTRPCFSVGFRLNQRGIKKPILWGGWVPLGVGLSRFLFRSPGP